MNKTEARTLVTIVKNRCNLLRKDVEARYFQLVETLVVKYQQDAEKDRVKFQKELDDILKKMEELEKDYKFLLARARNEGFRNVNDGPGFEVPYNREHFEYRQARSQADLRLSEAKINLSEIGRQLNQVEQELTEDLLIGQLASEDARTFLKRIPSLDSLLPATLNGGGGRKKKELPNGNDVSG